MTVTDTINSFAYSVVMLTVFLVMVMLQIGIPVMIVYLVTRILRRYRNE